MCTHLCIHREPTSGPKDLPARDTRPRCARVPRTSFPSFHLTLNLPEKRRSFRQSFIVENFQPSPRILTEKSEVGTGLCLYHLTSSHLTLNLPQQRISFRQSFRISRQIFIVGSFQSSPRILTERSDWDGDISAFVRLKKVKFSAQWFVWNCKL